MLYHEYIEKQGKERGKTIIEMRMGMGRKRWKKWNEASTLRLTAQRS